MSRPQYSSRYTESSPGAVVNGGLIDFQDNLNRGVCEYLSPNQIALQQQQQQQAGYPQQQQAFYPQQPNVAGYPLQQPQAYMAQPATLASPTCFNGPPSFIHAHGVTYRPVEATLPEPAVPQPASISVADCDPMMEEHELEHKVNQRVAHVSKAYVKSKSIITPSPKKAVETRTAHGNNKRAHHHHSDCSRTRNEPVEAPVFHRATRAKDVESAAQSVKRANASMPIVTRFPLRY